MSFVNQLSICAFLFTLLILFFAVNQAEVSALLDYERIEFTEFRVFKVSLSSGVLLLFTSVLCIPQVRSNVGELLEKGFNEPFNIIDNFFS